MLRGLSTVTLFADDVAAASGWYTEMLGMAPYFVREIAGTPAYAEFRLGDHQHELGIIDRRFAPAGTGDTPGGAVVYWHVDDLPAAVERLVSGGAVVHEQITERGPGFVTASVIDPYGNILGVMYNQHYLDILRTRTGVRPSA
ncbi:VOC family protein [Nocardia sp. alder85J]|uniref:VOC family protein n=1 Tax=Nocardia sp. alder85J TaxID=2862949 RepID=UPI001CD75858|nr:VOC family protein [Nocardia sp. alder85J]MCX4094427.1 VOC family protein [Nocardia sp. alder85J]